MHTWTFEKRTRQRPSGENMAEPNFSRENKNIGRLFIREFFQNVIDARKEVNEKDKTALPAHVKIKVLNINNGLNCNYLEQISKPLLPHLKASGHLDGDLDWKKSNTLVLEEFNTKGLTGSTNDSYAKGETERWANFWFGEGKRSKTGTSLGRAGQGKITYHILSKIRSIFSITRRLNDENEYLFGKCIVREHHQIDERHFTHHGYWPFIDSSKEDQPIPEKQKEAISVFKAAFQVEAKDESGTSWVIPFVPEEITEAFLKKEILREFFFIILSKGLTVHVDNTLIDSQSLQELFLLEKFDEPTPDYFNFLVQCLNSKVDEFELNEKWQVESSIKEDSFKSDDLKKAKQSLADGKIVKVKTPINIFLKNKTSISSFIDVYLACHEQNKKVEESYVRSGLIISEEEHLRDCCSSGFGLVVATDFQISEFLGYCEVASHLKWNSREQPAQDRYLKTGETLNAVRKSLPKIFTALMGSTEAVVEDAFNDILSFPEKNENDTSKNIKKHDIQKRQPKPKPPELFSMKSDNPGEWTLEPGKDAEKIQLPLEAKFVFAYDRTKGSGNPWKKWHPYDFDLNEATFDPKKIKGLEIKSRDGQTIILKIKDKKFNLKISGFSKNQRLLIKLL